MVGVRHGFGISPYMQELMTYAGHMECYVRSHEILEQFLSIKVSPSQVYRVTDHVSESLEGEDAMSERTLPPVSQTDVLYVGIDGSMICTRNKESWKEIKLARLFRGSDCLNPNSDSSYLTNSQYVGHFGNSVDFGEKLQKVIDSYGDLKNRLVFLTDGAAWIREWIADHYPLSCSILDFFHVMEHLYQFADQAFPNAPTEKAQWCEQQKELLLTSQVETVIDNIAATQAGEKHKKQLMAYYQNNKKRMRYAQYRKIGCGIIGSGAIESAHRTVIQKRMKLSGQRWSTDGVKNMLRLRIISMNRQWAKVIDFLKMPTIRAA
jgi:transposase-like protein